MRRDAIGFLRLSQSPSQGLPALISALECPGDGGRLWVLPGNFLCPLNPVTVLCLMLGGYLCLPEQGLQRSWGLPVKVNSPDFGQDPGCVGTLPEVIADGTLPFSDSPVLRICFSVLPPTMSRQCSLVWGERIC